MSARGALRRVITRHSVRNGHTRSDAMTIRIVVKTTRKEESSAKPAPGPMYASAGISAATSAPAATANVRRHLGVV
jgi:hypothetical protein